MYDILTGPLRPRHFCWSEGENVRQTHEKRGEGAGGGVEAKGRQNTAEESINIGKKTIFIFNDLWTVWKEKNLPQIKHNQRLLIIG